MQRTRLRFAIPIGLLTALLGGGCGGSGIEADCTPPCGSGETCVDGICVPVEPDDIADSAPDAPEDEAGGGVEDAVVREDSPFEVVPDDVTADDASEADAATTNVGTACASPDDCDVPGVASCITTLDVWGMGIPFANGYCSAECDPTDPAACDAGSTCISLAWIGLEGCMKTCSADSPGDCRTDEGYLCFDLGSWGFGLPSVCSPQLF
jgi:hypothetical protein